MSPRGGYEDFAGFDLNSLIARPLYFGLLVNVVIPAALLLGCSWIATHKIVENQLGDSANLTFFVFCGIALVQAGLALWWRQRRLDGPMIRSDDTFSQDLSDGLARASRPIFVLISSISIWGYAYFLLTGRFREGAALALFSFLVFQVVRPRAGAVRKLIKRQQDYVRSGMFLK